MINQQLLREVIVAVEETPAEQLTHGELVNSDGCMCALGAFAYKSFPWFHDLVERIRRSGGFPEEDVTESAIDDIKKRVQELNPGDNKAFLFGEAVYVANDRAYNDHEYESPKVRKAAILAALNSLLEFNLQNAA